MVDYSKFDHIGDDSSDDGQSLGPQVTKLEGRTTIKVGKDGGLSFTPADGSEQEITVAKSKKNTNSLDYSRFDKIDVSDSDTDADDEPIQYERQAPPTSNPPSVAAGSPQPSSSSTTSSHLYIENGQDCGSYFWKQCRDTVTVYFNLPENTKGRDVSVSINPTGTSITVKVKGKNLCPDGGELKFPVVVPPPEDDFIDWEIMTSPKPQPAPRVVRLALVKKSPPRVLAWWNRVFVSEEPTSLPPSSTQSERAKKSENAWKQAHDTFRSEIQKLKEKMPEEAIRRKFQEELSKKEKL
eukprot:TRINITY_DN19225_c0_g1_i1.p1 TRINITY_DN19225_c0_g1~~TRINITY_DN19225_c0_g1_i1.p1  ORF type:complete len:309 (+),score=69.68 TRINITY_DN19225_c0_g1_i1:41-928(+)